MKPKMIFCILLVTLSAYGCAISFGKQSPIDAFEVNENCPNVCWLGINPGRTILDDAIKILSSSGEIDQGRFFKISEDGVQTVWKIGGLFTAHTSDVYVSAEDGLVKSISLGPVSTLTMGDFVHLFGEPDKIIIRIDKTIDGGDILMYSVFFSSYKASIFVYPGNQNGPTAQDTVASLVLNADFTYPSSFDEVVQQTWLGYGHLKDYLPEQAFP
jgi:hypothetical protein